MQTQDNSYWVTDYYCEVCNGYLKFPSTSNAKEYNSQRSASVSLWLWLPVYVVLVFLVHQQTVPKLNAMSHNVWVNLVLYVLLVLLLPMAVLRGIHNMLPKFLVENIALLLRAPVITAIEALVFGLLLYAVSMVFTWVGQLALLLEFGFILTRIPVRLKEIVEENRTRNILNRRR